MNRTRAKVNITAQRTASKRTVRNERKPKKQRRTKEKRCPVCKLCGVLGISIEFAHTRKKKANATHSTHIAKNGKREKRLESDRKREREMEVISPAHTTLKYHNRI